MIRRGVATSQWIYNINECVQICMRKLHGWNKKRLNGIIHGAIERKEKEIYGLCRRLSNCRSPEIIKAEIELEGLLEEEEMF